MAATLLAPRAATNEPDLSSERVAEPGHRLDIQGLRGIAVLIVVLYHVGVPGFDGGFVGVDIFFVISGFVIGKSLLREIDRTGTIRLRSFWVRRARRLIPAFAVMMLTTLALGTFLLELGQVQQSATDTALAGTFSAANLQLERAAGGYFASALELNPYLHLWSLGVEEQFYLVLPLLVIAGVAAQRQTRWSTRTVLTGSLCALSLLSLTSAERLIRAFDQESAFFSPVSRFWEMGAGVLLALVPLSVRRSQMIAMASVSVLAVVVFTFSAATRFPGLLALPVVASAAGFIAAAPHVRWLQASLSHSWLTWIGNRSYGWYLWHWPLIVMARQTLGNGLAISIVAAACALIPTAISYWLIEQPVTRRTAVFTPRRIAVGAVASIAVVSAAATIAGIGAARTWGWTVFAGEPDGIAYTSGCHAASAPDIDSCTFKTDRTSEGTIVLAGDSHAASLADGVIKAGNNLGYDVAVFTQNLCPFIEVKTTDGCEQHRDNAMGMIRELEPVAVVVAHNSTAYRWLSESDRPAVRDADGELALQRAAVDVLWAEGLAATRARLDDLGAQLVSIDPVPIYAEEMTSPTLLRAQPTALHQERAAYESYRSTTAAIEHSLVAAGHWIDLSDVFCSDLQCRTDSPDGTPSYFDKSHLNRAGSLRGAAHIRSELKRIFATRPEG